MSDTSPHHAHFARLLEQAANLPAIPTSVVAPEKPDALAGALLGADHGLIDPILIGDMSKIEAVAGDLGVDISAYRSIDVPNHDAAAAKGVALVHEGAAKAVMKGHLHTDVLLRHVVKREGGLRIGRRLSHVFVTDVPGSERLVLITDGAINVLPDLTTKADTSQNAIDLARTLGVEVPHVAILSAVESVTEVVPSTLDAAEIVARAKTSWPILVCCSAMNRDCFLSQSTTLWSQTSMLSSSSNNLLSSSTALLIMSVPFVEPVTSETANHF